MGEIYAGGCLCGAVRYEVQGPALQTSLCHCEDCRRASGAPVVAWTFFSRDSLEWTRGTPKRIAFAGRERSFCGECGTPLKFFDPAIAHLFEVSTCSLDEPAAHLPGDECWTCDDLGWVAARGEPPRYSRESPIPEGQ